MKSVCLLPSCAIFNPWRACALRVTAVVLCVSVCYPYSSKPRGVTSIEAEEAIVSSLFWALSINQPRKCGFWKVQQQQMLTSGRDLDEALP